MPRVYLNLEDYEHQMNAESSFTYDHCYDPRGIITNETMASTATTGANTNEYSPSTSSPSEFYNDCSENLISFDDLLPLHNPAEKAAIRILAQPVEKFRFRYLKELRGTTHEKLCGKSPDPNDHSGDAVPTVQITNCAYPRAIVRCTLVTADEDERHLHPNCLCKEKVEDDDDGTTRRSDLEIATRHYTPAEKNDRKRFNFDPFDVEVARDNGYVAKFSGYGIIKAKAADLKKEIARKRCMEILGDKRRRGLPACVSPKETLQMNLEAESLKGAVNLNAVALCFQGFYHDSNDVLQPLTEKVYSSVIKDSKNVKTGLLKICRISKTSGSCLGSDELWMLVDKVDKGNIKVKFCEVDENDKEVWKAYGTFGKQDVHRQFAIVLRTPAYRDRNIQTKKEIYLRLERESDGEQSNIMKFCYNPAKRASSGKRLRPSDLSESSELTENIAVVNSPLVSSTSEPIANEPAENSIEIIPSQIEEFLCDRPSEEFDMMMHSIQDVQELFFSYSMEEASINECSRVVPDSWTSSSGGDKKSLNFAIKDIFDRMAAVLRQFESGAMPRSTALAAIRELLSERTSYENTLLHCALYGEQRKVVEVILKVLEVDPTFESVVNLRNYGGKTPLHLAVSQGRSDVARALLKLGADPSLCDEEDENSLHVAVLANATDCVREILTLRTSSLNFEAYTGNGWTALHVATKLGSLDAVRALLEAGADVNSIDLTSGATALHAAVRHDRKDVVDYLLNNTKVDTNTKDFDGNTALDCAGVDTDGEIVRLLLKHLNDNVMEPSGHCCAINDLDVSTIRCKGVKSNREALNILESEMDLINQEREFGKETDLLQTQVFQKMHKLTLAQSENEKLLQTLNRDLFVKQ